MVQMLKDDFVITAKTVEVLDEATFMAKDKYSGMTMECLVTKGLIDLTVKSDGSIVKKFPRTHLSEVPKIGTEVAIFGLTDHWVPAKIWDKVSWAVNAQRKFRAYAYDRKLAHNNRTTELTEELLLTAQRGNTLIELIGSSTRGAPSDAFAENYSYGIKKDGGTMSYRTRWEMFDATRGFWITCSDPRPIGKVEFES